MDDHVSKLRDTDSVLRVMLEDSIQDWIQIRGEVQRNTERLP